MKGKIIFVISFIVFCIFQLLSFSFAGALVYSTYLGGGSDDEGYGIAIDSAGNAYITGVTSSSDFPTTSGALDTSYNGGSYDVFVSKLNASGTALVYSTYLGGGSDDYGYGIAVDSSENAYITGVTLSTDFPTTPGAFDTSYNGGAYYGDVFVNKLNESGTALVYSTYLGGGDWDEGRGIAIDSSGNAYITGYTTSADFPTTPGAFDTSYHGVFVTKLNPNGTALVYSTYLGGGVECSGYGIAVDSSENAYITGMTESSNFPTTPGAFDTSFNGGYYDVFASKLNPNGTALIYSTYLGGGSFDDGHGIAVDGSGNAYIIGWTNSTDFPTTPGSFDTSFNGGYYDVFVSKLNPSGTALVYSTYLGGGGNYDDGYGIAVDGSGNAYITGETDSFDFPTTSGALDTSFNGGSYDVFVTKLNPSGTALIYSTYLGGGSDDRGYGIAIDGSGNAYITGGTSSSDFPTTPSAFDTSFNGSYDVFVSKLGIAADTAPPTGSIVINNSAAYTSSTVVTLTLNASDALSGVTTMRFSTDSISWSIWEPYKTYRGKYLTAGVGTKYVYVQYKDVAGNPSIPYFDTIVLETTAPTGNIIINNGSDYTNNTVANLTLSASDDLSGVTTMRFSVDNSPIWSIWEPFKITRGKYLTAGAGMKYVYVQYKDIAGNQSIDYFDTIVLETTAPTGSIIINSGATYTNSTIVTLTLNATDAVSGVTTMRFSNDSSGSWSIWESYKTWRSKYLTYGNGTKSVNVQYQDKAGNVSNVYSDTIILDMTPPTGSIVINGGATYTTSTVVTLTLSATDAFSGVSTMRFSNDIGTTWFNWEPFKTLRGKYLTPGAGTKTVTVQYRDTVGNQSIPYTDDIILQSPGLQSSAGREKTID